MNVIPLDKVAESLVRVTGLVSAVVIIAVLVVFEVRYLRTPDAESARGRHLLLLLPGGLLVLASALLVQDIL